MKRPLLPLFLTSIFLLFLTDRFCSADLFIIPLSLTFLLIFLLLFILKFRKLSWIFFITAISGGMCLNFVNYKSGYFRSISTYKFPQKEYITLAGTVADFPVVGIRDSFFTIKTDEIIDNNKKIRDLNLNIGISVKGKVENLSPGDRISLDCIVAKRDLRKNFYKNHLEEYFFIRNIHFNGFTKSPLLIRNIKNGGFFFRFLNFTRERIRKVIDINFMKENGRLLPTGQLLEALLTGDRRRLDNNLKEELINAGVFHLFAISGAHIGIIAFFLIFILKKMRIRKRSSYLIVIFILLFFLAMTGFKISAQRAVIMAIFILTGKYFGLKSDPVNIISASGIFILLMNPAQFKDPGFILTFFISFGILSGREIFFKNPKILHAYFREFLSTNISASVVSLPLSLFFFKRYSFAGFFSSLLLIPLAGLIMSISLILIPVSIISTQFASILITLIKPFTALFFLFVRLFGTIPGAVIYRPSPAVIVPILFYILVLIPLGFKLKQGVKRAFAVASILFFLILVVKPKRYTPVGLETYFLDVGQGDSEVVVFPGGDSLLIDGGGSYYEDFEVGRQIVLPFIIQKKIDVKWIAVSHFHPDHARGVLEIVNILSPDELWISSFPKENIIRSELFKILKISIRIVQVDSSFKLKKGDFEIRCLYPEKIKKTFYETNNNSQVLKISGKYKSLLFTGDIEKEAEKDLVKNFGKDLMSSVIKVPHHGSDTSSTKDFVRMVSPEIAVISASQFNRFGFPHEIVVKRYINSGARILSTAFFGGIMIRILNGKIELEKSKFSVRNFSSKILLQNN